MDAFFRYTEALVHKTPFDLSDPISIKAELEEDSLNRSTTERFPKALFNGVLSVKSFAKLNNFQNISTALKPQQKPPQNYTSLTENKSEKNLIANTNLAVEYTEKTNQPKVQTRAEQVKVVAKAQKDYKAIGVRTISIKNEGNMVLDTVQFAKAPSKTEETPMYYCHVCKDGKKITRSQLKEHFVRHEIPVKSPKLYREARAKQNRPPRPDIRRCEICWKEFANRRELDVHLQNHENEYICDTCKAGFKKLLDYIMHMQIHDEDNLFRCSLCDFNTDKIRKIRAHLHCHHEQFRKYKCDICNKGFTLYSYLQEHTNFHTGQRPFQCDVCGISFMYTRYLNSHKRKHAYTEKNFVECPVCKKVLPNKQSYNTHKRIHQEAAYCCDLCGKTFVNRSGLRAHANVHSVDKPHKCKFCDRGFTRRGFKDVHERTHTGEKPYKCPHCEKAFSQRTSMVRHSYSHTGKWPYNCYSCKKGFKSKPILVSHLKTPCKGEVKLLH